MKFTKNLNLELEVKGHKKMDDGMTIAFLVESIGLPIKYNNTDIQSFYMEFGDARFIEDFDGFSTVECGHIDLFESTVLQFLFEDEDAMVSQLLPHIHDYLINNKVPHMYMNEDEPVIAYVIMEGLETGDYTGSRYGDHIGTKITFEYDIDTNILKLDNKYLTRTFELESPNYDDINDACKRYGIEWNNIVAGKFEYDGGCVINEDRK